MLSRKSITVVASLVALQLSASSYAKDFTLHTLAQSDKPTYDLGKFAGKKTYYSLVHEQIAPAMQKLAASNGKNGSNEEELKNGGGISVRLSDNNYNIHINFPNGAQGGRSYGWTNGQVGDWSDAMYLDKLSQVAFEKSATDLKKFYAVLIEMLGSSNAEGKPSIENLVNQSQRVAANFLAIYTAEEYRAIVPNPSMNWDDAILEVTLLSAFHSGQSTFTKFYLGEFSAKSKKQGPGVYAKTKPGPKAKGAKDKDAEMNDYWQYSADPNSTRSGINLARGDFEAMGTAITTYEAKNANLKKIESIVGSSNNVIKGISKYFTSGKAKVADADELSEAVASFLMDVRDDADAITKWELAGEKTARK